MTFRSSVFTTNTFAVRAATPKGLLHTGIPADTLLGFVSMTRQVVGPAVGNEKPASVRGNRDSGRRCAHGNLVYYSSSVLIDNPDLVGNAIDDLGHPQSPARTATAMGHTHGKSRQNTQFPQIQARAKLNSLLDPG